MRAAPKTAFIVSHTHWDREWYRTYNDFRVSLVRVVREVLHVLETDDSFRHFLLDGQAIVLEDYLEIHPEDTDRIRKLVQDGALSVGPWYILPDEFLVSGESTVRNLLLGHKIASAFGRVQQVGYMPDSFGHIAQMPQILRQTAIDSFIYTRGSGDEIEDLGHEYFWQGPDGSEVLAINQCGGYCNAGGLGLAGDWEAHTQREPDPERAVDQVRELFSKMARLSQGDIYLVNNGCDHLPPQRRLGVILQALRKGFPDTEFKHASLADYIAAVKAASFVKNRFSGELIHGRSYFILSGVWSTRMYLKQHNDYAQTLISDYVEPLSAYSHFLHHRPYPGGMIEYLWKLLLENHPHDSICGCSTDEVHREMLPRFGGVIQAGERLIRDQLQHLVPTFARRGPGDSQTVICVANTLPERRTEVVERLLVLQPPGVEVERLQLLDESGRPVAFTVLDERYVDRFWGVDYRTELFGGRQSEMFQVYVEEFADRVGRNATEKDDRDCFLTVQFLAENLPALGHANYYLRERRTGVRTDDIVGASDGVLVAGETIENEYLRVQMHPNGTFDVVDKRSGNVFPGLNRLKDTEDVGDEYDYCPCVDSLTLTSDDSPGRVRAVESTGLSARLEAEYTMRLPKSIESGRRRRGKELVDCRVVTRVGLKRCSPIIEVELVFDNRAKDHRLRVEFPTPIETDTVISDGHFYINHRPIERPDGTDWMQPPPGTYPQQDFTLLQDGEKGLAVFNRGLPEIAATGGESGGGGGGGGGGALLSLTLLRAVGWLSRDDLDTRRNSNAGPTLHTPGAQCLGEHRFQYAVVPFAGDYLAADIKGLSRLYRTPALTMQGVEDRHVSGGVGLLWKTTDRTCISAIKQHEVRDTLLVRLYNLSSAPVEETLVFGLEMLSAWRTNLLEERTEVLVLRSKQELTLGLRPHEIVSLEVEFARPT